MKKLFSRRHAPPPTTLRYDFPIEVRSRILATLADYVDQHHGGMPRMLKDVGMELLKQYGCLLESAHRSARQSDNPSIEHFHRCETEKALDFVEACFRAFNYNGGQAGVDAVNVILREHGIGYEFTRYVDPPICRTGRPVVADRNSGIEREFPRALRRDNQLMHAEVTAPALELLALKTLRVANSEILSAYSAFRAGRFEDAITSGGSAFESVLKTICDQKGWAYDSDKDTCSKLVDICYSKKLFPVFYVDLFKRLGTVRNKLGDAHGRGPVPQHEVQAAHADHMLHMTCAHIILLCRLAGLH